MRRLLSFGYNQVVRLLFDLDVRDVDCAFKIFRSSVFDHIQIESPRFLRQHRDPGQGATPEPPHPSGGRSPPSLGSRTCRRSAGGPYPRRFAIWCDPALSAARPESRRCRRDDAALATAGTAPRSIAQALAIGCRRSAPMRAARRRNARAQCPDSCGTKLSSFDSSRP